MPVTSRKLKKKRIKTETLSQQEALDFAQLILDIFKDKKQV
jgi:hypothetical protein